MARFRNVTDHALYVPDLGRSVQPDEVVDVPGDVVGDAAGSVVVMRPDGDRRLWPTSTWAEASPAPAPKPAPKKAAAKDEGE